MSSPLSSLYILYECSLSTLYILYEFSMSADYSMSCLWVLSEIFLVISEFSLFCSLLRCFMSNESQFFGTPWRLFKIESKISTINCGSFCVLHLEMLAWVMMYSCLKTKDHINIIEIIKTSSFHYSLSDFAPSCAFL